jgi:hypothetical protein
MKRPGSIPAFLKKEFSVNVFFVETAELFLSGFRFFHDCPPNSFGLYGEKYETKKREDRTVNHGNTI